MIVPHITAIAATALRMSPSLNQKTGMICAQWPALSHPTVAAVCIPGCGVLVFRLDPAAPRPRPCPPCPHLITQHSSLPHFSHLTHHTTTHHSSTSHTSRTTSLITPHSSRHNSSPLHFSHLTYHISHHITTHHSSTSHASLTTSLITPALARGWLLCGRRNTQRLLEELVRAWAPLARGWLSCGKRTTQRLLELVRAWALLARGWLSCGRRSTQCLLEELLRAWAPLARGWLFVGQTGFRGKGVVLSAFWRSWCARRRRWPAAGSLWGRRALVGKV